MKRSHGSGSIQQRGENSWRLRYYVGDARHETTFRGTKKEAETKLRSLLSDADKGVHVAPGKTTLNTWAAEWIALKAAERQHKTVARYEDLLKKHVLPVLGERPLQKIEAIEIKKLYASGMTDLAPRTRHHVATVLKACLHAAVDLKLLQTNPAAIKKPVAADSDVGQALEQDKIVALVEGFRNSTLFDLVFVMSFTGMRRGEALALRWSDFDPEAKTLRIEQALEYTKKYGLRFKEPKSARGKRTINLDDGLVDQLIVMRKLALRVVAGIPDGENVDLSLVRIPTDWLIFPAPDGDMNAPRHPDSVTKQFVNRAEKILGFSIRLHDLRVSHGTWLLDQGVPVHVVAKRLGHDPSVLLRVYAKRTQKGDEAAADTIGQLTRALSKGPK
ncbi:integrase [Bradyrhizobium japonicum]|uniref:site-specific integrase n=1 Tax=Bradyrhizobium japonicum TaxID=375 RepID=UPI002226AFD0|nr:site-specific integrase [Bradyrhizobium japonicum]MCW2219519.1 integrase [Bradyrhizobium japonicum]MCW2344133.1 integrase [Bradyrhizobium japonicum]